MVKLNCLYENKTDPKFKLAAIWLSHIKNCNILIFSNFSPQQTWSYLSEFSYFCAFLCVQMGWLARNHSVNKDFMAFFNFLFIIIASDNLRYHSSKISLIEIFILLHLNSSLFSKASSWRRWSIFPNKKISLRFGE